MAFKPMVKLKKGQVIGSPLKAPKKITNPAWANKMGSTGSTKMTPEAVAKRKKTTVSNAAGKLMGGLYSQ